jgi:glycosyltransferase involved in cell wall biosynthesis
MLEAGLLARLSPASTPLVVTYQCDLARTRSWSAIDRLAVNAVLASGRAAAARAQKILVSSVEYAEGSPVVGRWPEKWVEVFPPDNAPPGLQPHRVAADGCKVVGFLGRFVEKKGIDVILDAIPLVIREQPQTRFVLAGDHQNVPGGSQMTRLQGRLQSLQAHVEIPGRLPADRLFDFYRSLDLFLLPSVNAYEAFGIVQIEAMKAGVPVIATDLRGVRVPVRLTGCGRIVPPGDSQALAAAINSGLRGEWLLTPADIAARAWNTFSNQASVDKIRHVYEAFGLSKGAP